MTQIKGGPHRAVILGCMRDDLIRFALCEIFEQAALWRAVRPSDRGSAEAAGIFRRLIATAGQVEEATMLAYAELWDSAADMQAHSDLVKSVGLRFRPASASDFVARFIAERTGGL